MSAMEEKKEVTQKDQLEAQEQGMNQEAFQRWFKERKFDDEFEFPTIWNALQKSFGKRVKKERLKDCSVEDLEKRAIPFIIAKALLQWAGVAPVGGSQQEIDQLRNQLQATALRFDRIHDYLSESEILLQKLNNSGSEYKFLRILHRHATRETTIAEVVKSGQKKRRIAKIFSDADRYQQELGILLHLQSTLHFVPKVYDNERIDDLDVIVMEKIAHDAHFYFKEPQKRISKKRFIRGILKALDFCHTKGIIHGDLKLSNILYSSRNIVLCDFDNSVWVDDDDNQIQFYGTWTYTPPELLTEASTNGFCADLWAVGILAAQLLLDDEDFMRSQSQTQLAQNLTKWLLKTERWAFDSVTKDFLDSLLSFDPKKRITAGQALSHQFLVRNKN